MGRIEKIFPSVIARVLGRPVEIHFEGDGEDQAEVSGSVVEKSKPAPAPSGDFFAEEIKQFGGGKVFEKYLEGKEEK